ncbi:MAG: hypothetical protein D6770_04100 [Anaerolineae bacterium]|nr:MAG: hypothetical protein D6770_04100 [Anaerolineae bacterium]
MPPHLDDSLLERLKTLGVSLGPADPHRTPPQPSSRYRIEDLLPGESRQTPSGEAFVYEQRFPAEQRHGRAAIRPNAPLEVIAAWAREPRLRELPLESLAFLDTETSSLVGGTGTYVFLVGVGRFEGEAFRLAQFFLRDPAEEPAMLEALAAFLAPAEAVVTYNGKTFDLPLLRTRYTLYGVPSPLGDLLHLDLLPLARRLWRPRLPSRTLKFLEEHLLDAPRGEEEVPGYEIPYIYFDYLHSGDARPLKGVFYHNAMDILALAALLSHIAHLLEDPLADGRVEHGLDLIAIARLYEDLGHWEQAARLYERGLEKEDLTEADYWSAVRRLSILQKRRGDLAEAVRWWEQAAARGHVYACVELAKYYEHRVRDFAAALHWTGQATALVENGHLPPRARARYRQELRHRAERLRRKQSPSRSTP